MKNLLFIALVVGAAFLGGCNKGGSMSEYRVKVVSSSKGQSTEFIYSADNKIASIKTSDSTKVTFTFAGNTVTQSVSNPMNPTPRVQTFHLTSSGYVDSTVINGPMGNALTLNKQDADGYNTLTQEYYGGALKRSTQSVYKDGNEVTSTISDETMKPVGTIFFEYYTDKLNSFSNETRGMKFMGKDSKNLVKKVVQVLAKGDTVGTANFSYKFDDKGRMISQATYEKGMAADSINISYY
jgi:hypothetical protein